MRISTPEEKFVHEIGDIYDAEYRFLEGQQNMLQQASSPMLKQMIQEHIAQTQQQIRNLEQVYNLMGQSPDRVTCDAAVGLVREGQKVVGEAGNDTIRDCLIAGALAKVEHYEVASYRGLVTGAQMMGMAEILDLLQFNLQQEEQTASMIETSAPQLLQQAMQSYQRGM